MRWFRDVGLHFVVHSSRCVDDAAVSGGGAFGCALLASGYADTFGLAARKGVRVPCIGFRKLRALEPPAKEDPKP